MRSKIGELRSSAVPLPTVTPGRSDVETSSADAYAVLSGLASSESVRVRETDVDLAAGPVLHALDHDGRLMLLLPLTVEESATADEQSRGVSIRVRSLLTDETTSRFLAVKCELPALASTFASLSDDILVALRANSDKPSVTALDVLDRWRNLLGPPTQRLMSESALLGLLAELRFLERLIGEQGAQGAVTAWTGPTGSRQDFTTRVAAVEVKGSTSRDRVMVEVHGLEQLDAPEGLDLYLWVEHMERTPNGGDSVPDALQRILELGTSRLSLMDRVSEVGYSEADRESYTNVRFRHHDYRCFAVDDRFPRLIPASLAEPGLAQSLMRVRYTLDVTETSGLPGYLPDPDDLIRRAAGTT